MLRAVVDQFGGDILLLQHDGWTSAIKLDLSELERHVQAVTGYSMTIEEAELR